MGDVRKFSAWSFLRNVLMQGRDIHLDHVGKGYESYSARVDEAASEREQELERAIAARGAVPEGWVLVPVKPTKFMMDAAIPPGRQDQTGRREFAIWSAMLAAAPQPAGECCDTPACCFRDAYVGAREDLSDWKGRAQRAEAELRRLGYAGIDASVPPSQPAGEVEPSVYVECRLCDTCEHVGINDEHDADAACHDCEWHGPAPVEDKCPGCGRDGTMTAACPKCSGRYTTLAVTEIPAPPEPAPSAPVPRAMPEGFVMVPIKPSSEMREAGRRSLDSAWSRPSDVWSAMLAAAPQPAGEVEPSVYVECRLCDTCEHVGINDAHSVAAACLSCEWNGPAPDEDKCPKCGRDGTMAAACPKCCGRYMFMADTEISVQAERALSAQGEAIGWGEIDHGRLVSFTASRTERNTTPLYTHPAPAQATHPDDLAVDRFAVAMKAKLASARAKGRGGWDGPECNADILSRMLRDHVDKGDPRDVANFCMFLHQRGEAILPAPARVTEDVRGLLERALPFLRDEAGKYDDDGSNEPLEIAREIEAALEADHG